MKLINLQGDDINPKEIVYVSKIGDVHHTFQFTVYLKHGYYISVSKTQYVELEKIRKSFMDMVYSHNKKQ